MILTVLTAAVALAPPATIIDYGTHLVNPSQSGTFRVKGWSADGQYFAYDTGLNGGGALATSERAVVSAALSRTKAYWRWEEEGQQTEEQWLDAASADTFAALGIGASAGHLVYQYHPSYFQANHRLKPPSLWKHQYSYTLNGVSHAVVLEQYWEPNWTPASPGPGAVRYHRAKAVVRLNGRVIGETEFQDAAGYSIDRIYLSPNRDTVAVVLARFTLVWFEGVNLLPERQAFVGSM